jgi:hypothetical protein
MPRNHRIKIIWINRTELCIDINQRPGKYVCDELAKLCAGFRNLISLGHRFLTVHKPATQVVTMLEKIWSGFARVCSIRELLSG